MAQDDHGVQVNPEHCETCKRYSLKQKLIHALRTTGHVTEEALETVAETAITILFAGTGAGQS